MESVCCKGAMHQFRGQREQKVFVVNEFHLYCKDSWNGMEGVWHKEVSQLLQKEWEWKVFVIREFHICKHISHLLQREMTRRLLPHLLQGFMELKVFVIRGFHNYYKERRMQDVCHTGVSHLLQGDNGRCLLYMRFTSVTRREACMVLSKQCTSPPVTHFQFQGHVKIIPKSFCLFPQIKFAYLQNFAT